MKGKDREVIEDYGSGEGRKMAFRNSAVWTPASSINIKRGEVEARLLTLLWTGPAPSRIPAPKNIYLS